MGRVRGPICIKTIRKWAIFKGATKNDKAKIIFEHSRTSSFALGGSGRRVGRGSGERAGSVSKPSGNEPFSRGLKNQ